MKIILVSLRGMAHPKTEQFAAWLSSQGLRPTPQRLHVAEILLSSEGHPTAEELVARARDSMPSLGASTAWRALGLLVRAGLVDRHRFGAGGARYEERADEHHDHILCLDCGRVIEVADPQIEARQVALAQRLGFRIVDHVHEMEAHCLDLHCPHRQDGEDS
jgi:Fur family ferric uptake transcriptional regulator